MKRVTIQDIAKEMGLSRNTVAKALSNGNVSPETRQAVVQKACQMGYAKLDDALVEEVMHQKRKPEEGQYLYCSTVGSPCSGIPHWQVSVMEPSRKAIACSSIL